MTRKKNTAAIALVAMAALAGCGSSDQESSGQTAGSTPAVPSAALATGDAPKSTPVIDPNRTVGAKEEKWAADLCTAMAGTGAPPAPPTVDASSTVAQSKLVNAANQVVDAQGDELRALKSVGEPPVADYVIDWKRTYGGLQNTRAQLKASARALAETDPADAAALKKAQKSLETRLQVLHEYGGTMEVLISNPRLAPAFKAEPACKQFS